jgi:UDP-3-O-[3-hydroxymyristoyl] glucosamine N-acyltransferase
MSKIKIIGYNQATLANDFVGLFRTHGQSIDIIEPDDFLQGNYKDNDRFVVAVTRDLELRKQLITTLDERLLSRATLVHSSCVIDSHAEVGEGSVISQFASALWRSTIGRDCLVAPYCMIAHQSSLGQGSLMQPGAMIAGSTTIGSMCVLGMRSNVIDKLSICDWVEAGAAALITKNIEQSGLYLGQPARRVNKQE